MARHHLNLLAGNDRILSADGAIRPVAVAESETGRGYG